MSDFYDDLADIASDALSEFGTTITLRQVIAGTYDPVTGTTTGGSTTDVTVNGIAQTITEELRQALGDIQGGDRVYLLDATQAPTMTDKLVIGSDVWTIVQIRPIQPADTILAHIVQARK